MSSLLSAFLLALPLLLASLILTITMGTGEWKKARWVSTFTLHPEQGLAQQGLLWFSILVPFLYGAGAGLIVWEDYRLSLTAEGLSNFIKISPLPIALFSLALPLSILISRLHATAQTANQIRLTRYKNNIDSFYSHRKELFSYFQQIGEVNFLDRISAKYNLHPRIHKTYFVGKPESGTPVINDTAFKEIQRDLDHARWTIDNVVRDYNPENTFSFYIANACSAIYNLALKLGLTEIYIELADKSVLVPVALDDGPRELLTVGTSTADLIAAYRYAHSFFDNLCDFAGYKPSEIMNQHYNYLLEGGAYKTIKTPLVIERLHSEDIPQIMHENNNKSFEASLNTVK